MCATRVRIMVAILWAVGVTGVCLPELPAGDTPQVARGADKGGEDALGGNWKAVSVEMYGKEAPGAEALKKGDWVITAAVISFKLGGEDVRWDYKSDASKKPKTIDLTATSGPEKGKTVHGIWVVEGDTLKLCFDKERPKEFVTKPDIDQALFVFKRDTK